MSYFQELKRRNVFRVSAAYLALSWVITQVTETVVPALNLPESIPTTVIWLGVIGFPFVVLFSWVYELTPEGLKRESEVSSSDSITRITGRRLDYIIIALLAVAILLVAVQQFLPSATLAPAPTASESDVAPSQAAQAHATETPAIPVNDKSIAVLPFVNMSSDKEQEYFSDGMSEELLNLLAQVPDLRVIARTSSFAFKGQNIEIAEIAKKLNVSHVLEGSVRKSGNTLRITAQLIRTADSTHLWSESYDRPLDDIFAVQDEIAGAIVQALQIKLAGGELSHRKGGTQNLEAYQLFLRAVAAVNQNTKTSLEAAGAYLDQAIRLDPNFGTAWMQLAYVALAQGDNGFVAAKEAYERSRQLAQQALELSPELADAHAVLQYIHLAFDWDWAASEAEKRKALALDPTNSTALNVAGKLSSALGRWDDAERQLRASLARDPLNTFAMWNFGNNYYRAGKFIEAEAVYRKLLDLAPEFSWTRGELGKTLLAMGKPQEALEVILQDPDEGNRLWALPAVLKAAGRKEEANAALQAQIEYWADTGAICIAMSYAYFNEHDLALEWLERAYQQKDVGLTEITGEPLFLSMAEDPRYKAFLRKMNLPN